MQKIILVDEKDNILNLELKEKCHLGEGILHRAFSVFIFNKNNELLIQKRSKYKKLWPLFWSNSCCSHPLLNESYEDAAKRRLKEELGINCEVKYLFKFQYSANYKNIGSENELCAVLIGKYDGEVFPNKDEVDEIKWVDIDKIDGNKNKYTPWFLMEIEKINSCYERIVKVL